MWLSNSLAWPTILQQYINFANNNIIKEHTCLLSNQDDMQKVRVFHSVKSRERIGELHSKNGFKKPDSEVQ